jgi:hypothetical protein
MVINYVRRNGGIDLMRLPYLDIGTLLIALRGEASYIDHFVLYAETGKTRCCPMAGKS